MCRATMPLLPLDDDDDRAGAPPCPVAEDPLTLRRTGLLRVVVDPAATGVMPAITEAELAKTDTGNERVGSASTL